VVRRGRIPVQLPIILVLLGLAAFSIYRWQADQRGDPEHLIVSGTVEADEVDVGSKVGGRLSALLIHEGDVVTKGTQLAQFETDELNARQRQLAAGKTVAEAQAMKLKNGPRVQELAQARAGVEAANAQLQELTAGSRKEDIAAAEAIWRSAEAQATQAAADYDRAQQLFAQDVIARADLDAALARSDSTQRNADAAKQQFAKAKAGPRPEEISAARARVKEAQAAYDLLASGSREEDITAANAQVDAAQADIDALGIQIAESKVFAPDDGTILSVNRQVGDLVLPNQPVFNLLLTRNYYVQVFIPENKLSWARPGTRATLHVDTYPEDTFTGTVTYLSTQGEFTPRNLQTTEKRVDQTFRCKVTVEDPGKLRPGMMCDVTFHRPGNV
jgi:multidrug resistance efflux pump